MRRRSGAGLAVLALLYGLSAAPYTHAHYAVDAVLGGHHPHGHTLVHSHATPHAHDHDEDDGPVAADDGHGAGQTWSVDSFVFPQTAISHVPVPVVLAAGAPPLPLTSVWVGAHRSQPMAHGPPPASSPRLRAPPVFLPSYA